MWAGIGRRCRWPAHRTSATHVEAIRARGRYGIVADYGGHGIGTEMHQDPHVLNYGKPGKGPKLVPGLALAIEPMITMGSAGHRGALRRLDGGDPRRLVGRALRAHVRAHRRRPWVLTALDGGRARLGDRGDLAPAVADRRVAAGLGTGEHPDRRADRQRRARRAVERLNAVPAEGGWTGRVRRRSQRRTRRAPASWTAHPDLPAVRHGDRRAAGDGRCSAGRRRVGRRRGACSAIASIAGATHCFWPVWPIGIWGAVLLGAVFTAALRRRGSDRECGQRPLPGPQFGGVWVATGRRAYLVARCVCTLVFPAVLLPGCTSAETRGEDARAGVVAGGRKVHHYVT